LIKAGSVADAIINNVDFAPTMLDLAGQSAHQMTCRAGVLGVLEGQAPDRLAHATYYRYWMHMAHHDNPAHYGLRTQQHKLIFFYGLPLDARGAKPQPTPAHWELYDLAKDPHEMNNVYADPDYQEIVKKLKAELLRLKEQVGDTDQRYPELMKVRSESWE
jgi:arylsulfatase A-like enzyme